jgi:hypothetical protein
MIPSFKQLLPESMANKLDDVLDECRSIYVAFDPENYLHQMFAMQIMLARELEKLKLP